MPPSSPRTLVLTERVPRRLRMSPTDVGLLLARYPGRFEVVPAGRRGLWRLTARGCAGVVVTPTVRLIIRPKISLDNLFFLIDPTAAVLTASDRTTPVDGQEVFDFLAGQFALRLARLAAAGLQRGYRERAEQGVVLQGRLDLAAQLREGPGRQDQLHYRFDDFTLDVSCNQALKTMAVHLLSSPLVSPVVQGLLRHALGSFDGVRALPLHQLACDRDAAQNLSLDYVLLLDLGQLLIEETAPGPDAGPIPGPAFLLNMERVWERYVTRTVCDTFAGKEGTDVAVQRDRTAAWSADRQPLVLRPDIVLERGGRASVVIDAKWKRLGRRTPPTEDLYQVMAYATALGASQAILVYPGRRDAVCEYTFEHVRLGVVVRRLRARGPRHELQASARRFMEELATLAESV